MVILKNIYFLEIGNNGNLVILKNFIFRKSETVVILVILAVVKVSVLLSSEYTTGNNGKLVILGLREKNLKIEFWDLEKKFNLLKIFIFWKLVILVIPVIMVILVSLEILAVVDVSDLLSLEKT